MKSARPITASTERFASRPLPKVTNATTGSTASPSIRGLWMPPVSASKKHSATSVIAPAAAITASSDGSLRRREKTASSTLKRKSTTKSESIPATRRIGRPPS